MTSTGGGSELDVNVEALFTDALVGEVVNRIDSGYGGFVTLLIGRLRPSTKAAMADLVLWISGADWRISEARYGDVVVEWRSTDAEIANLAERVDASTITNVAVADGAAIALEFGDYRLDVIPEPPYESDWTLWLTDHSTIHPAHNGRLAWSPSNG